MRPRRVNTQPPTPERVRAMRYRRTWVAAVANTLAAVLLFGFSPTRESHPVATAKETARSIAELDRAELDRAELDRARLLLSRATYGPRPQDLEELLAIGAEAWVQRQLRPESIAESSVDKRLDSIEDLSLTTTELMVKYPRPTPEERRRAQQRREQEQNEPLRLSDSVDPEMDDGLSGQRETTYAWRATKSEAAARASGRDSVSGETASGCVF